MKITVITVAYNAAATIEKTIRSVAEQKHPDVEHLVIDGDSPDGTAVIVQNTQGRVSRMISEPDDGIYDAMNKGLALATGEIIGFLNADDVYAHEGVLAQIASLMERESLDAVFADAEFFHPSKPEKPLRCYRSRHFRPDRIAWGWMPAHPTLFLRRWVYERFGPFRTDYRIAGDFEFIARVFHGGTLRYRYVPEVFVRMQAGGVSTSGWRSAVLLNREVLRACRENRIKTNMFKILSKYPLKVLEFIFK